MQVHKFDWKQMVIVNCLTDSCIFVVVISIYVGLNQMCIQVASYTHVDSSTNSTSFLILSNLTWKTKPTELMPIIAASLSTHTRASFWHISEHNGMWNQAVYLEVFTCLCSVFGAW